MGSFQGNWEKVEEFLPRRLNIQMPQENRFLFLRDLMDAIFPPKWLKKQVPMSLDFVGLLLLVQYFLCVM